MLEVNTILYTRDGRKVGNAIIIAVSRLHGVSYEILTDYGNQANFTFEEIKELFYIDYEASEELFYMTLARRENHKNSVDNGIK